MYHFRPPRSTLTPKLRGRIGGGSKLGIEIAAKRRQIEQNFVFRGIENRSRVWTFDFTQLATPSLYPTAHPQIVGRPPKNSPFKAFKVRQMEQHFELIGVVKSL